MQEGSANKGSGRDVDRYGEQRKESRCGLWAETAESPRLFSLLHHIVNPRHFLWSHAQKDRSAKRQREAAQRTVAEENKKRGGGETGMRMPWGEIPSSLSSIFRNSPLCADITLKGPGGGCLFPHPPQWAWVCYIRTTSNTLAIWVARKIHSLFHLAALLLDAHWCLFCGSVRESHQVFDSSENEMSDAESRDTWGCLCNCQLF